MNTACPKCGIVIEYMTFYPHLKENYFKPEVDLSTVSQDLLEEVPPPHLHAYYECTICNYKICISESPLLLDEEVEILIKKGNIVRPERTTSYWSKWLKNKGK